MIELGRGLQAARLRRGKTQAALAAELQVEQPNISLWEAGKVSPQLPRLVAIAAALGAVVIFAADGVRVQLKK